MCAQGPLPGVQAGLWLVTPPCSPTCPCPFLPAWAQQVQDQTLSALQLIFQKLLACELPQAAQQVQMLQPCCCELLFSELLGRVRLALPW